MYSNVYLLRPNAIDKLEHPQSEDIVADVMERGSDNFDGARGLCVARNNFSKKRSVPKQTGATPTLWRPPAITTGLLVDWC